MSNDWVKWHDAVRRLEALNYEYASAAETLQEFAISGHIPGRALRTWDSDQGSVPLPMIDKISADEWRWGKLLSRSSSIRIDSCTISEIELESDGLARAIKELPKRGGAIQLTNSGRGGRPREHDWDGMYIELIRIANTNPDGLPEKQADTARLMADWFFSSTHKTPADSEIKKRVSRVYASLAKGRK